MHKSHHIASKNLDNSPEDIAMRQPCFGCDGHLVTDLASEDVRELREEVSYGDASGKIK